MARLTRRMFLLTSVGLLAACGNPIATATNSGRLAGVVPTFTPTSPVVTATTPARSASTPTLRTASPATGSPVAQATVTSRGRSATVGVQPGVTAQTASARVQAVSPLLHPRSQHTATLLPNGEVLVVGGSYGVALSATGQNQPKQSLATIREFHTGTKQWATVGQLGAPRNGHTVTCLADDTILVVGGVDRSNGSSEPTVERIDLGTP